LVKVLQPALVQTIWKQHGENAILTTIFRIFFFFFFFCNKKEEEVLIKYKIFKLFLFLYHITNQNNNNKKKHSRTNFVKNEPNEYLHKAIQNVVW